MGNKNNQQQKPQTQNYSENQEYDGYPQQQQQVQQRNFQYPVNNFGLREKERSNYGVPSRSVLDDDQELDIKVLQQVKLSQKSNYELAQGLQFSIRPIQKAYKINSKETTSIPAMISVKTLDSTTEIKSTQNEVDLSKRPGIDLICVIDHSGSMSGQKIQLVQQTLEYLLGLLNEKDRLSIIEFDDKITRLTPLIKVNKDNNSKFQIAIKQLQADGGTNISLGMGCAFQTIKERQFKNQVTSVFLLSDGLDGGAEQKVEAELLKYGIEDNFTIHTFGFGADHDPHLMSSISQLKDGSFYFVEKLDQVDECFVDALGGLFSIVAQEVVITLQPNRVQPFTDQQIQQTYGEMWLPNTQTEEYTINISQLMSGVSKEFIFEISMPPCNFKVGDQARNSVFVTATLVAQEVGATDDKNLVQKEAEMLLTIFNEDQVIPVDSEVDEDVQFNILRVRGAEVIQEAIKYAESQQYELGQKEIDVFVNEIGKSKPNCQQKLEMMVNDLKEAKESCKPRVYEQVGSKRMAFAQKAHMEQRSKGVEAEDMYSNCVQMQMKNVVKSKKSKF